MSDVAARPDSDGDRPQPRSGTARSGRRRRPLFTVVIPTRDRPAELRRCLAGLAALDFPRARLEVIVVNDGGAASPAAVVAELGHEVRVHLIEQPRGGPAVARNAGAALATGKYLAFIDDDCSPDPGWLTALHAAFRITPHALVGGRIENALPDNPYATASQLITSYAYEYYERYPAAERFFTTNNFAVAARGFRAVGGFDTHISAATAEDKEFCDRWRADGQPFVYTEHAVVRHAHRLSLRSFVRQHYNYGRGILCFRVMRRARQRKRLWPEPLSFYYRLLRYPLDRGDGAGRWRSVVLLVVSQVATIAGALRAATIDVRQLRR
ncbi:MAG: glycosyltransferase [Longimicrobiales bacterium]